MEVYTIGRKFAAQELTRSTNDFVSWWKQNMLDIFPFDIETLERLKWSENHSEELVEFDKARIKAFREQHNYADNKEHYPSELQPHTPPDKLPAR